MFLLTSFDHHFGIYLRSRNIELFKDVALEGCLPELNEPFMQRVKIVL